MSVLRIRPGRRMRKDQFRLSLRPSVPELLVRYGLRHIWGWRREVLALLVLLMVPQSIIGRFGSFWGRGLLLGLVLVVLVVPVLRRAVVGWLLGGRLRRRWAAACHACRVETPSAGGGGRVPRIRRARRGAAGWHLRLVLSPGLSVDDLQQAAGKLTATLKLREVRISPDLDRADRVGLVLVRREVLGRAVRADLLPAGAAGELDALPIGVREDRRAWLLPLRGSHVLIAGATGAGKGSVIWSIIRALAPSIRGGVAEVWACDPKGGMELAFGEPLFARFAVTAATIADLLEDAVTVMERRTGRLRGVARSHTPTPDDPLIVIIIDEVASLTAYVSDAEVKKRIAVALQLLLSQGRAPGVVVVGALQDPGKDVLPFRDLFPVRVALRLTEPVQINMVLGEGARDRGALCDRVPRGLPGVGYVLVDEDPTPVRVRAGWLTDDDIRTMAAQHAPVHPTTPMEPAEGWRPQLPSMPSMPSMPPCDPRAASPPCTTPTGPRDVDDPTIPLRAWRRPPPPPALPPAPPPVTADDGSPAAEQAWARWEEQFRRSD